MSRATPLARFYLIVGLAGAAASALSAYAIVHFGRSGPIGVGVAVLAALLLFAQAAPLAGLVAYVKLGDARYQFTEHARTAWLSWALATTGVILVSAYLFPPLAVLTSAGAATWVTADGLARRSRPWIVAWVMCSFPVLFVDLIVGAVALWLRG